MAVEMEQRNARNLGGSQGRILVVEDNASFGARLREIVERTGAAVDLATSEADAIARIENQRYDVALVDIMLSDDTSDRGGITVIQRIRDVRQPTRVIVISGASDVDVPVDACRIGVWDYLVKGDIRSSNDILASVERAMHTSDETPPDVPHRQLRVQSQPPSGDPPWSPRANVRKRFERLAETWATDSAHLSSPTAMALLPSYQEIIGMGPDAVPLILERLSARADHWFWALRAITGVNPVSKENVGRIDKMAEDWLRWGRENGIVQ